MLGLIDNIEHYQKIWQIEKYRRNTTKIFEINSKNGKHF